MFSERLKYASDWRVQTFLCSPCKIWLTGSCSILSSLGFCHQHHLIITSFHGVKFQRCQDCSRFFRLCFISITFSLFLLVSASHFDWFSKCVLFCRTGYTPCVLSRSQPDHEISFHIEGTPPLPLAVLLWCLSVHPSWIVPIDMPVSEPCGCFCSSCKEPLCFHVAACKWGPSLNVSNEPSLDWLCPATCSRFGFTLLHENGSPMLSG